MHISRRPLVTFGTIGAFDPTDTNATGDIYIHDRQTGQTVLVSLTTSGGLANGLSLRSAASSDARFVAFGSSANNLVANDTNGLSDIFVRDRGVAPPGDCNGDGNVNLDDHTLFEVCLLGPNGGLGTDCECFDFDSSDNVDLKDFAALQNTIGSN